MSRPFAVASALAFDLDARLAETRAHLEERLARKNVPEARARELRARFEAASAKISAEVARVAADGVVTREEAREVRAAAHLVRAELRHALRGRHADRADRAPFTTH